LQEGGEELRDGLPSLCALHEKYITEGVAQMVVFLDRSLGRVLVGLLVLIGVRFQLVNEVET